MSSDNPNEARRLPETGSLFRLDIKGDRQNLAYQSLHQASVPKYHSRLNAIGLDRRLRLSRISDTRHTIVASGLESAQKHPRPQSLSFAEPHPSQFVRHQATQSDAITDQIDFVSLKDGHQRKRRRLLSASDSGSNSDASSDNEASRPDIEGSDRVLGDVYQRQRELREKVVKQPKDIEAWFAMIELQQDLILATQGRHGSPTAAQRRTIAELRIAVYREALSEHNGSPAEEKLVTGLMKEGSKIWDHPRQLAEWSVFIKNSTSVKRWLHYLGFLQSHSNFSYEDCVNAYQSCLLALNTPSPNGDRDRNCIYIILRLTIFMKQSGFGERALAIWQAIMELNLCRPSSIPSEEALSALEDFWNSENPRFGEPDAKGWDSEAVHLSGRPRDDPTLPAPNTKDLYRSWYVAEETAASHAYFPATTMDNTSVDDAYRVVLFTDIRNFLLQLSSDENIPLLLDAVLCYCGLPLISDTSSSSPWREDPFLYQPRLFCDSPGQSDQLSLGIPFTGINDITTLFASTSPFSALPSVPSQLWPWAQGVVEQVASRKGSDNRLGFFAIALTLHNDPVSARKLSRRLIKRNPGHLELYNAFALVESRNGNQDSAENVWQTTLKLKAGSREPHNEAVLQLWRTWIFELLLQRNMSKIWRLLRDMSNDQIDFKELRNPGIENEETFTRSEQWLQSHLAQGLMNWSGETILDVTDLLAVLRYCQNNLNLAPVLETYQNILAILEEQELELSDKCLVERLHQRRSLFIHVHTHSLKAAFEPKQVLRALSESVKAFPNNSIFAILNGQYQQRYGLMDRLRGIASDTVSSRPNTLVLYLQHISSEMSRTSDSGGTEHSIRAAFKLTNDDESLFPHFPALRLAHVQWEINLLEERLRAGKSFSAKSKKQDRKLVANAVEAFHAAIRTCPWFKQIYLLVFGSETISTALGSSALKGVYETIMEKGLRVHVDISDMIQ